MNKWDRKRLIQRYKVKFFSQQKSKKYFLIGIVAAIMNWFLAIPILGLISLIFFLLGVIGHLI